MIDILLIGGFIFIMWYFTKYKTTDGFVYSKYPIAHKNSFGSMANPSEITRGYRWTSVNTLAKEFKKSDKNTVYIDNFRFDEEFAAESKISNFMKNKSENKEIYFNPLSLTQGMVLFGKMGSGKSEYYFNILRQKFFSRAVIHQVKAGDFSEKFFRKNHDILFSPFDERGTLWNVMDESEGTIKTFFENYANAIMGDKKDFFTAASNRIYNELSQKIRTKYKNETAATKWLLFIKSIKDLFEEMEKGSQNSQKDIKGTMEAILQPLEIMAWQMQNPKQKTFVIRDFLKKKNQCKLILDNIPEHEKSLTPLFSAFTASLSQVMTSMPDSKTDFTLLALDEFLSFATVLDDASMKRLFTLIRSKGGIMMPAVQYVPKDNKKLQQLLTSSAFAWVYFSVIEEETVNLLKNTLGETHYTYKDETKSVDSKGKTSYSYSTKKDKYHIIYNELLNGLAAKFEHIMYIPNLKYLYIGYTPQVSLKTIAEKIKPVDLTKFSDLKYIDENEPVEDVKNLSFGDLFKNKKLSKLDEYKLFKEFEKAKDKGKKRLKSFKSNNALEEVNLNLLFKDYMLDNQVLSNKMKLFDLKERSALKDEFDTFGGDREKEFAFIKKHNLFAALPNIFEFDDKELKEKEDDWG